MESITIFCTNHQCLRCDKCARYARNNKRVGGKTVHRFDCERNGYKYYTPIKNINKELNAL